jgi:F0F1-type ATP synthase membrane subunit b/b'
MTILSQHQLSSLAVLLAGAGVHPAISKAVNLALFLGVLYLLMRKPARQFFADRFALVRATLEHAAREKEAATAKMAELDARLNRLDEELKAVQSQAAAEAAAERARIEAETRQDIEKIKAVSKREVESAKLAAMSDLRDFAATKAVDLAEQMIRREMKPEDDAKLLKRMADAMSAVN